MASIPTTEACLLNAHHLISSPNWQTKDRRGFVSVDPGELSFTRKKELVDQLLHSLGGILGSISDPNLWRDFLSDVDQFTNGMEIERRNTKTFSATKEQVLWVWLANAILPCLGRKWAFWALDPNTQLPSLPGGDIWFVPRLEHELADRLRLPVQLIAKWWRDLLGGSLESIWTEAGDDRLRTFQNWSAGATTPDIAKVMDWFSDDQEFEYSGIFTSVAQGVDARAADAVTFIRTIKKLESEALSLQCPGIPVELAQRVLTGGAYPFEKKRFLAAVERRWSKPDNRTVRLLFLFARALEQGFKGLVEVLTPGCDPRNPNPLENKSLQLVELFRLAFTLTTKAEAGTRSMREGDQRFEQIVPSWLSETLFYSATPRGVAGKLPSAEEAAAHLTLVFQGMVPSMGLPDFFCDRELTKPAVWPEEGQYLDLRREMVHRVERLHQTFRSSGPDRQAAIATGLSEMKSSPIASEFQAEILLLEGLDQEARGNFQDALTSYNKSLKHSDECSSGRWGQEAASRAFQLAASVQQFQAKLMRSYFQRIGALSERGNELIGSPAFSFDQEVMDAARAASARFWEKSFRPYNGVEVNPPLLDRDGDLFRSYIRLAFSGANEAAIKGFIKANRAGLKRKLLDVSGDTFFGMALKMSTGPNAMPFPNNVARKKARKVFLTFAKNLPTHLLDRQDYRGQSALMLAAVFGDDELVSLLLGKSVERDCQDFLGRTALHSAVMVGSKTCVQKLLKTGADSSLATRRGLTPLGFAVELGRPEVVEVFVKHARAEPDQKTLNSYREILESIIENYDEWASHPFPDRTSIGQKTDYQKVAAILSGQLHESVLVGGGSNS